LPATKKNVIKSPSFFENPPLILILKGDFSPEKKILALPLVIVAVTD